jgi:stage III sporulation protein AG
MEEKEGKVGRDGKDGKDGKEGKDGKKTKMGALFRMGALFKGRGRAILLLVAALGAALLLFGGQTSAPAGEEYARLREEYRKETEQRVAKLCAQVKGVGRVSVLLTLEAGEEYVYAKDEGASGGTDYVTGQSGGLLLYRRTPKVAGVAVVCDGGGNESVANRLRELLHATLDVPYSRISISPAKSAARE